MTIAAAVTVIAVAGAVLGLVVSRPQPSAIATAPCSDRVPPSATAAEATAALDRLDDAFLPVARSELDLLSRQLQQFLTGTLPADDMARLVDDGGANFAYGRTLVARLSFPSWAGDLGSLFTNVAALYVEAADSLRLATTVEGESRVQLIRKSQRERRMADALYDRGRALLSAPVPATTVPGSDIHPPVALPDLSGVEEGPPFSSGPPPRRVPGETAPGEFRIGDARCQPLDRWRPAASAALDAAAAALRGHQPADVDGLARANASLGDADLPAGHVHEALVIRGTLYLYEEMARSNRAATVNAATRDGLVDKARRLRVIADGLMGFAAPRVGIEAPPAGPDRTALLDEASPFDPSRAPAAQGPTAPPDVQPVPVTPSPAPSPTPS